MFGFLLLGFIAYFSVTSHTDQRKNEIRERTNEAVRRFEDALTNVPNLLRSKLDDESHRFIQLTFANDIELHDGLLRATWFIDIVMLSILLLLFDFNMTSISISCVILLIGVIITRYMEICNEHLRYRDEDIFHKLQQAFVDGKLTQNTLQQYQLYEGPSGLLAPSGGWSNRWQDPDDDFNHRKRPFSPTQGDVQVLLKCLQEKCSFEQKRRWLKQSEERQ